MLEIDLFNLIQWVTKANRDSSLRISVGVSKADYGEEGRFSRKSFARVDRICHLKTSHHGERGPFRSPQGLGCTTYLAQVGDVLGIAMIAIRIQLVRTRRSGNGRMGFDSVQPLEKPSRLVRDDWRRELSVMLQHRSESNGPCNTEGQLC